MIYFKRKAGWKRFISKLQKVTLPSCEGFFGFLKVLSIFFLVLIISIYSLYLFLLPKYITDDKVENYINDYLKLHSKLSLDIQNLKITPSYNFDIKLKADKLLLNYPDNKNFITLDNPDIEVDLINLFFNYLDLNKIKAKKITINTNFTKNNRYNCFDYINDDIFELKDLQFNLRNIKIICDELIFNLYDENVKKNFKLQTKKLSFFMSDKDKPVTIETQGNIQNIADFKLKLELDIGKDFLNIFKTEIMILNYNPLASALKFKFHTNSDINLKIKKNAIFGYINLSEFNFAIDNIQIPKNNLFLNFKGQKIKLQGDFNFIKNQFIKIDSIIDYSKNKFIELKLNSSELNLADLKNIAMALCRILNIKYDFNSIVIDGIASADIYLKSDFKTITSRGFAKIQKARLKDGASGLILNDINSDISFNNNKINIKNTTALVDKSLFHLEGVIDEKTNLDLKINSDLINIAQILSTIKSLPLVSPIIPELNDYTFKSGFVRVNAFVSGNLNNPVIKTNSQASDIKLFIKPLKCLIQTKEATISANPEGSVIKDIFIIAKNNIIQYENNKIINSQTKLKLCENDIIIEKTQILFDKIKADIEGVIKNYKDNPLIELNLFAPLPIDNNLIIIKNKSPKVIADVSLNKEKLTIKTAKVVENSREFIKISGAIFNYSKKILNLKI